MYATRLTIAAAAALAALSLLLAFAHPAFAEGWYLMVPGESTKAPLSKWHLWSSYDTAAECEAQIYANLQFLKKHQLDWPGYSRKRLMKLPPRERRKEVIKETRAEGEWAWDFEFARCIATDDPRLKSK